MRLRLLALLLTAIPTLFLTGCEETPTEPDRRTQPMMPLAVGNMWIGRSYGLDTAGAPTDVVYDTTRITGTQSIAGETWYVADDGLLLANRADGLWMAEPGQSPRQVAKHPASVGEIFSRDTVAAPFPDPPVGDSLVDAWRVVAVGMSLTVTAGTYRVNGYEEYRETLDGAMLGPSSAYWGVDERYFAPAVGPVRRLDYVAYLGEKYLLSIWELVEARLQ